MQFANVNSCNLPGFKVNLCKCGIISLDLQAFCDDASQRGPGRWCAESQALVTAVANPASVPGIRGVAQCWR